MPEPLKITVYKNPLYDPEPAPESVGTQYALPAEYDPTAYGGMPPDNPIGTALLSDAGRFIKTIKNAGQAFGNAAAGTFAPMTVQPNAAGMVSDEDIGTARATTGSALDAGSAVVGVGGPAGMVENGLGMMGGKMVQPTKTVPTFYSAVENAVNNIKQEKMSGEQWLGTIANSKGVKAEELNWTGLNDYLGEKKEFTKKEVEDYIKNNKVELKEKELGGDDKSIIKYNDDMSLARRQHVSAVRNFEKVLKEAGGDVNDKYVKEAGEMLEVATNRITQLRNNKPLIDPTKYQDYQLPGGDNYRESLLSLPQHTTPMDRWVLSWENKKSPFKQSLLFNTKEEARDLHNSLLNDKFDDPVKNVKLEQDKIPDREKNFQSSHWEEPNVLAHIRTNDRNIEGKKSLHIEELQSDWHQKGRKEGYKITDEQKKKLNDIDEKLTSKLSDNEIGNPDMDAVLKTAVDKKVISQQEAQNYKEWSKGENSNIPDAPFKKTWLELSLKKVIREAAEKGYDRISWTPGEAQAARYDLSKEVKNIGWNKQTQGKDTIVRIDTNEGKNIALQIDSKGNVIESHPRSQASQFEGKNLSEIIGKEHAEKILAKETGELSGEGLKIGGEGMKTFYDEIVPKTIEKLGKEHGVKVKETDLPSNKKYKIEEIEINKFPGAHLSTGEKRKIYDVRFNENGGEDRLVASYHTKAEAAKKLEELETKKEGKIFYIDIPQSLKDTAMHKGFPLFSNGLMLTPSDDPFKPSKYKLVPTDKIPEFE